MNEIMTDSDKDIFFDRILFKIGYLYKNLDTLPSEEIRRLYRIIDKIYTDYVNTYDTENNYKFRDMEFYMDKCTEKLISMQEHRNNIVLNRVKELYKKLYVFTDEDILRIYDDIIAFNRQYVIPVIDNISIRTRKYIFIIMYYLHLKRFERNMNDMDKENAIKTFNSIANEFRLLEFPIRNDLIEWKIEKNLSEISNLLFSHFGSKRSGSKRSGSKKSILRR
jgi:hypothetical protein